MKKANDIWSLLQTTVQVIAMIVVLWLLLAALNGLPKLGIPNVAGVGREAQIIVIVLVAVTAMLVILTSMAVIFKEMKLSDPTQALGLPEGSIRALIALLLLMMFVIFSIYLFRQVVGFDWEFRSGLTEEQINTFAPADIFQKQNVNGLYNVWLRIKDVNSVGQQFSQEIFTAMLTLVTAVSSFYFASKGFDRAQEAKLNQRAISDLSVTGIAPNSGEAAKGKIVITNLAGMGFADGAQALLRRVGETDVVASNTEVLNESRLLCTLDLAGKPPGKWDVIVINPDNKEAKLAGGFEIV